MARALFQQIVKMAGILFREVFSWTFFMEEMLFRNAVTSIFLVSVPLDFLQYFCHLSVWSQKHALENRMKTCKSAYLRCPFYPNWVTLDYPIRIITAITPR